ncbi:MAG: protein kinase [bacterium]|nr:protein kinase [bacterium]
METILLLEAISNHAEMMRTHLEKRNFKVLISPSTTQAKEILEKQNTDFLVIDLNIADKDFSQFYRWVLERPETSLIPRLFIAGKMQQEIAESLETGNKETILNKPLDVNRFISTIDRLKSGKSPILRKNRKQDYFESLLGKKIGTTMILKEIGRGGMGAVFLGHQENLDRKVAVKLLLPEMVGDTTAIERFQREALAIARLKSPHIVQVYDYGEMENRSFHITMEYIPGQTVDHALRHKGRFPLAKALSVVAQVATGLTAAHDAGLIHRDIKPSNLIMDNKGHVTITDFGLVRPQEKSRQTQTGMIVGTPHYLPPEQTSESRLDARSDIYSLGIVFYHLLVGHPPFLSSNPMEILMKHLSEPLPDPRKTIPAVPQEVVDIIERMTAKDPNERYINCRELLWDLKSREIDDSGDSSHIKSGKKSRPNPASLPKVDVDTSFFNGHEILRKQFPILFEHGNLLGAMTLSKTGTLISTQGRFPEEWKNALYILQESTHELNAAAQLGEWNFKIMETQQEVLALFPEGDQLGSMLASQKDSRSFASGNLQSGSGNFLNVKTSTDPVRQFASLAGVLDILHFDTAGQLVDYSLQDPETLENYKLRFAPVAQIIQSVSIDVSGMDLWYERGRILAWVLESGILFIVGATGINRSFLSIYITAHLEQLGANTNTGIVAGEPLTSKTKGKAKAPLGEVKNPLSTDLMEGIQLELARFIGPIAKVVLSKECKKIGYSRGNFPEEKLMDLVKEISNRVDESKRQDFLDKIQDVIYEFRSK